MAGRGAPEGTFLAQFPEPSFEPRKALAVLPLSVCFIGMITFNNLCLKYVEVSFYNVARSLTMCFNVVFTFFILGVTTSKRALLTVSIVVVGFWLGIEGEVRFSMVGTLFGVTSSCFVSLNSIYTKKVIPVVDGNKWTLSLYNNVNATLLFPFLILLFGELEIILEHAAMLTSSKFWLLMTLGGVAGFAIGIASIMQIQVTSPLTHNISGTAKAALQAVLAFWIWQNPATVRGCLGIAIVLGGSLLYAYVRNTEMKAKDRRRAMGGAKDSTIEHQRLVNEDGSDDGGGAANGGGGGEGNGTGIEMMETDTPKADDKDSGLHSRA